MWLNPMKEKIQEFLNQITEGVFPVAPGCPLCQKPTKGWLCDDCEEYFSRYQQKEFCRKCGKFVLEKLSINVDENRLCFDCNSGVEYPFGFGRAVGPYGGLIRDSLYQLKYTGRQSVAQAMGLLMTQVLLDDQRYRLVDLIVPVPIGPGKLQQRGFNQAELLGRIIGGYLNLPVVAALDKGADTPAQAKQDKVTRQLQVQGLYQVVDAALVYGRKVLLVDDVITTGSTAAECTRALIAAGAQEVALLAWATGSDQET